MNVTLDQIYELAPDARRMHKGYLLLKCPFHDDRQPSLLAFADGWFRCKGAECGRTGRLEVLYDALVSPGAAPNGRGEQAKGHLPRLPSAEDVEAISRLVWNAHDVLMRNESFRWYLELRGVADRVETAGLGWHEGWITVPILTDDRQVQGVVLRATKLTQRMTGMRFVQLTGQRPMLYCPDWALVNKGGGALFVVFGMFDALALSSLRFPVVTTTGGSQTFRPEWLDDMRRQVVILPDAEGDDEPARKLSAALGWRGKVVRLPYDKKTTDPADYLGAGRREELKAILAQHM